jgi:methyltransferase
MILFFGFILFVIFQRLVELYIANRNKRILLNKGAVEHDKKGYVYIVIMHTSFFIFLILEYILLDRSLNKYWTYLITIFLLTQSLRYWAIVSLGIFWNTRVIVFNNLRAEVAGPYKFFRHPNYLAVLIEIAVIPLIFSCFITATLFSIINLFVLRRRIRIEENALNLAVSSGA